jgi:uncharacterized membrane protein YccC
VSLKEIEAAISRLPDEELATFAEWFEEYLADAWDRRIEADIQAGRLDKAGREADEDFDAGRWQAAMKHFATPRFWFYHRQLPEELRELACWKAAFAGKPK